MRYARSCRSRTDALPLSGPELPLGADLIDRGEDVQLLGREILHDDISYDQA